MSNNNNNNNNNISNNVIINVKIRLDIIYGGCSSLACLGKIIKIQMRINTKYCT